MTNLENALVILSFIWLFFVLMSVSGAGTKLKIRVEELERIIQNQAKDK